MVRIDAYGIGLEVESKLAVFDLFQFVLVQIWPSPNPGINHVWKTFAAGNLKPSVQGTLDGDTFGGMGAVCRDGCDETV